MRAMRHLLLLVLSFLLAPPALAMDKPTRDFLAANLLAVYYHEFGHALVDVMKLPIYGQEEDAADVASVVMIHQLFDEDEATRIADAYARGFLGDYENESVAYWDVHGPTRQRYFNFVCIFYGANPQARGRFADIHQLPAPRKQTCPDEFEQADNAWGEVIRGLMAEGGGKSIRFLADPRVHKHGIVAAEVLRREVRAMNRDLTLPKRVLVRVEPCETVNAFYVPKTREIIICTEFAGYIVNVHHGR